MKTYVPRKNPYWSDLVNVVDDIDARLQRIERALDLLTDEPGSPHAAALAARLILNPPTEGASL